LINFALLSLRLCQSPQTFLTERSLRPFAFVVSSKLAPFVHSPHDLVLSRCASVWTFFLRPSTHRPRQAPPHIGPSVVFAWDHLSHPLAGVPVHPVFYPSSRFCLSGNISIPVVCLLRADSVAFCLSLPDSRRQEVQGDNPKNREVCAAPPP